MKFKYIVLFLSLFSISAQANKEQNLEEIIQKALSCRIDSAVTDESKLSTSTRCYDDVISSTLDKRDRAGLATWFNSIISMDKVWQCSGEAYNIKSYHLYTPNFICVKVTDVENQSHVKIIFFANEKLGVKVSSIYTPFKWK